MSNLPLNACMGWLQKRLPFCLCLSLLSFGDFTGSAGHAIASALQKKSFGPDQASPNTVHLAVPASKQPLPHLRATSFCPYSPPSASFNSQQLDQQLQRYLRFVAQSGKPDILIVGSSRALQGIDPVVLQHTLADRGYPNLKIFNFGVNGATAQLVDLLLREILSPDQLPRLVLWGDGVRAFNSGRVDLTYQRAVASQSYQFLAAGLRPTLQPVAEQPQVTFCTTISLPIFDDTTPQSKYFNVSSFNPTSKQPFLYGKPLDINVWPESSPEQENPAVTKLQETTGFRPLSDQFKPTKYFQRYPKVQGKYDADYRDFNLNGEQTIAFNSVMRLAQTHQIPVVFVNLPLTQIYLDETRALSEQQFRTYLQRFMRSRGLGFYDLSQRWANELPYFADPSHLNRYGAAAVAAELGRSLTLPANWLQGQR